MARTPTGDALALQATIGPRGSTTVTAENRNDVRRWLRARGIPSAIVQGLSMSVLAKAYNDEDDFDGLQAAITTIEQSATQERQEAAQEIAAAMNENETPNIFQRIPDQQPNQQPKTEARKAPASKGPAHNPAINPQDQNAAAAELAALIARMAGAQAAPLDEARVIELIAEHGAQPIINRIEITIPDRAKIELPDELRHEIFPDLLAEIASGNHVYLVGPAGSGKSTIGEQVARALSRPFYSTNAVRSPFVLLGYMDAKGEYQRTPFRDAFENGGIFLFDEIDASDPNAIVALNGALAQPWYAFPDKMVDRHPDFICIAGANTYGAGQDRVYVGRNQLDGASLDRFCFIEMDYDRALEAALCPNADWLAHVHAFRDAAQSLKLRHVISPRASIGGARSLAAGVAWPKVEARWLLKGLDAATAAKLRQEAAALKKIEPQRAVAVTLKQAAE